MNHIESYHNLCVVSVAKISTFEMLKPARSCTFKNEKELAYLAERIFEAVEFEGKQTAMVIDPPRKGCDARFLQQLLNNVQGCRRPLGEEPLLRRLKALQ